MRVSTRWTSLVIESSEAVGLRREDLLSPLGLDARFLLDVRNEVEWKTYTEILARLSALLGDDVDRIRAVGRASARAPAHAFLQGIARAVVSPHRLYDVGARWLAPAACPHIPLEHAFIGENRLHIRTRIDDPHAPSKPFMHFFEGLLEELPCLLGLPRATIISSQATPRSLDVVLDIPRSTSLVGRAKRAIRAALHAREALDLLEIQRRQLEDTLASLQRATAELQAVLDRLPDLVVIHRNTELLWVNRAMLQVLGHADRSAMVGRSLFDFVDPAAHASLRARIDGRDDGAPSSGLFETKLVARDGSSVLVEVFPAEIVAFGGSAARLVVGRDISERVRLQQQLLTADRMASIGMLAAGVAHEVNNPLAYVLNNVEIARRELAPLGESTRQSREALGIALEGVGRIRTIVRDLLELSRVDEVALGPIDVRAVVEATLALAAHKIAERATLVTSYEPAPLASGTASRLGQVLVNLLSNALEAMPVASSARNRLEVTVRPSPSGGTVVEVIDNGIGIPSEHASRIFDPFFTTKSAGSGTGLGLAISQRLVAEMGGRLTFVSAPQRGSAFRVTLSSADASPV